MHCDLNSWLGTFKTAEEAAKAYDSAARGIWGPSAQCNVGYAISEPQLDEICVQEAKARAIKLGKCNNSMDQRASTAIGEGTPNKVLREAREADKESSGKKMIPIMNLTGNKLLQVVIYPYLFND